MTQKTAHDPLEDNAYEGIVRLVRHHASLLPSQAGEKRVLEIITRVLDPDGYSHSTSVEWAANDFRQRAYSARESARSFLADILEGFRQIERYGFPTRSEADVNTVLREVRSRWRVANGLAQVNTTASGVDTRNQGLAISEGCRREIDASVDKAEILLANGDGRDAVREMVDLMETVTSAFQGREFGGRKFKGKNLSHVAKSLASLGDDEFIRHAMHEMERFYGLMSSRERGVRHGKLWEVLESGADIDILAAQLYCDMARAYMNFILATYDKIGGDVA